MAKNVTVTFDLKAGATVRIDNKVLTFKDGSASVENVAAGHHYLQWFGRAPRGTEYEIAITAPKEAEWRSKKRKSTRLGALGGSKQFKIKKS